MESKLIAEGPKSKKTPLRAGNIHLPSGEKVPLSNVLHPEKHTSSSSGPFEFIKPIEVHVPFLGKAVSVTRVAYDHDKVLREVWFKKTVRVDFKDLPAPMPALQFEVDGKQIDFKDFIAPVRAIHFYANKKIEGLWFKPAVKIHFEDFFAPLRALHFYADGNIQGADLARENAKTNVSLGYIHWDRAGEINKDFGVGAFLKNQQSALTKKMPIPPAQKSSKDSRSFLNTP
jgi:hypothetical protein